MVGKAQGFAAQQASQFGALTGEALAGGMSFALVSGQRIAQSIARDIAQLHGPSAPANIDVRLDPEASRR
jgi:hypothetical protein